MINSTLMKLNADVIDAARVVISPIKEDISPLMIMENLRTLHAAIIKYDQQLLKEKQNEDT